MIRVVKPGECPAQLSPPPKPVPKFGVVHDQEEVTRAQVVARLRHVADLLEAGRFDGLMFSAVPTADGEMDLELFLYPRLRARMEVIQ